MPYTPTYASLLTRLFSNSSVDRTTVLALLEMVSEADRLAVEPEIRARLRDSFPGMRLIAAEAVFRIYRDTSAAVEAIGSVIQSGEPAAVADAAGVLRQFGMNSVRPLVQMVRHAPVVFATQTADYHRWAADCAIRSGPEGVAAWLEMLTCEPAAISLLVGLAHAAPAITHDLSSLEAAVRAKLTQPAFRAVAGAALWRITWRVNRDWLASIQPGIGDGLADIRELLLDVLIEHLGRRPDVAPLVRANLIALAEAEPPRAQEVVRRLAGLGSLGWAVLIPMLNPSHSPSVRETIFAVALDHPTVLPLIQHHAHAAVLTAEPNTAVSIFSVIILRRLGPAVGMAIPDLLALAIRAPSMASAVGQAIPKLAAGFPNTSAAVVHALNRIRTTQYFGADHLTAFQAIAAALGELDLEMAPRLIENTGVDQRTVDLLLQQPPWEDAAPETRTRHSRVLADSLLSSRAEVRIRAAELLRHYRSEMPSVWPSLVAVLAGADEKAADAVLPHFRFLESVADVVVPELLSLFREPNPNYAARAVVALWRLGQFANVGTELRHAVESSPEEGWGWAVLRGVVNRVSQAHGMLGGLSELFVASPAAVAEKVAALVNPPESPEDSELSRLVPRPGDPTAPETVTWDSVKNLVSNEGSAGQLFFLSLMCEYGATGWNIHKIWLIKGQKELTRISLADSKSTVERVADLLEHGGRSSAERHQAVRDFFSNRVELPPEIVTLVEHRLSWFRWAGLELADAWGVSAEQVKELTADRVWDTSPRVRERASRMARG